MVVERDALGTLQSTGTVHQVLLLLLHMHQLLRLDNLRLTPTHVISDCRQRGDGVM